MKVTELAREIVHGHTLSLKLAHLPIVYHGTKSVDLDLVSVEVLERALEPRQSLLEGDGDFVEQVVPAPLEKAVLALLEHHDDVARDKSWTLLRGALEVSVKCY